MMISSIGVTDTGMESMTSEHGVKDDSGTAGSRTRLARVNMGNAIAVVLAKDRSMSFMTELVDISSCMI